MKYDAAAEFSDEFSHEGCDWRCVNCAKIVMPHLAVNEAAASGACPCLPLPSEQTTDCPKGVAMPGDEEIHVEHVTT